MSSSPEHNQTLTYPLLQLVFQIGAAASVATPAALPDRGVYSQLDPAVVIALPAWVAEVDLRFWRDRDRNLLTVLRGRDAVKTYPIRPHCDAPTLACLGLRGRDRTELAKGARGDRPLPLADTAAAAPVDTDSDGIPDAVDILIGGKKAVLLATPYLETARKLPYPGGDMPTNEGVCTDVVVRALRNAGIDLQQRVFEDAGRAPKAYPSIRVRNPSIDHRRVRNLMVYFDRHFHRLAPTDQLLPGDVALLDTFPNRKGIEHIGLVSDHLGKSGRPLIINAWTNGHRTNEMDLLGFVAAPAIYRVPSDTSSPHPRGFRLAPAHQQVALVISDSWSAPSARLSWWQRRSGTWIRKGGPVPVMLGNAGLAWGRGLLPASVAARLGGASKREGDQRAPAGVFRLSRATGYQAHTSVSTRLPYTRATAALRCVDDPRSPHYNQIVERPAGSPRWSSDEAMLRADGQYALTIAVDHNRDPTEAGAGSCIFLHAWPTPNTPSPGCTLLSPGDVSRLLAWLDPASAPVLIQLPRKVYEAVATSWDLPR
jgi:uncharacterized protein YijF (DUF1287 family)/L,D-peptidoglycan transpeptidase YkuD (ErfK/YbiS/YcfS/YnhG family)